MEEIVLFALRTGDIVDAQLLLYSAYTKVKELVLGDSCGCSLGSVGWTVSGKAWRLEKLYGYEGMGRFGK